METYIHCSIWLLTQKELAIAVRIKLRQIGLAFYGMIISKKELTNLKNYKYLHKYSSSLILPRLMIVKKKGIVTTKHKS